jgi:regulator of sigma E protease
VDIAALMGGGLQAVVSLLVVIVIIVTVHEFGHYIVGRWCGIHAEVFSIGFGKTIWSRVDKRGTRWQIATIPLGGYVRFLGDADAASRPGALPSGLSEEERRHTMQGAPLWARSATVLAGPVFNLLLTLAVFFGLAFYQGVQENSAVIGSMQTLPGDNPLQVGDRILSINGKPTADFAAVAEVINTVSDQPQVTYEVERDGQKLSFLGPNPSPPLVQGVSLNSAAEEAGMQVGDVVLTLAGTQVASFDQMPALVEAQGGKPVALSILRDGKTLDLTLTPRRVDLPNKDGGFDTRWLLGLSGGAFFEPGRRTPGVIEAAELSVKQSWLMAKTNLNGILQMIKGKISLCNLSGPIGMAKAASAAADMGVDVFVGTLALMSLGIGLANLLPIPVLDGGHLVFHVYEAIFRRPPNEKIMGLLMTAGLTILIGLMLFAFSNDLFLCN